MDKYVQLHEEIKIWYVVSHYQADYYVQDGQREVASGHGDSIEEAMKNLLEVLQTKTLQEWCSYTGNVVIQGKIQWDS